METRSQNDPASTAEQWLPVIGYEGLYEVSSFGRIKSLPREVNHAYGLRKVRERIMLISSAGQSHGDADNCYWKVRLSDKRTVKNRTIHRLVAKAFLPNPNMLPAVNHKDRDKANNRVSNLEWCTNSQNIKHAYDDDKLNNSSFFTVKCGKDHARSKKVFVYSANGLLVAEYISGTEAGKALGVSQTAISAACLKNRPCKGLKLSYTHAYELDTDGNPVPISITL